MTPEWISAIFRSLFLFVFWLIIGVMLAPVWLIVVIAGALFGAFHWKEVPEILWGLIMIEWLWG